MTQSYPAYKPTTIPWLHQMPMHWELLRNKYIMKEVVGRSNSGNEDLLSVSQYTGVTLKKDKLENDDDLLTTAVTLEGYKKVNKNDLIINIMLAWNGSLGISPFDGITSPAYSVYRFNKNMNPKYFHYFFRTKAMNVYFRSVSSGVIESRLRMYTIDFFNLYSFIPPLYEQAAIANYLDAKTLEINIFINKKEKLIAILKEQKLSIIDKAVTAGLNENANKKSSDIALLQDVPTHWKLCKLKHISKVQSGLALNETIKIPNAMEYPYLRVANVQDGYIDLTVVKNVWLSAKAANRFLLQKFDLLMNEGGDFDKLGRGVVWEASIEPCLHQNHVFAVRFKKGIDPYWINLLTLTQYGKAYFISKAKKTTNLASISSTNIKEFPILLPPTEEIENIKKYISEETTTIDEAINRVEKEIELVKELKQSLIAEVVTGKIKIT